MKSLIALIALIALGLVLAGCGSAAEEIAERAAEAGGGGDVDIELDDEGGEFTIESEDGTQTVNLGGGDLPSELTIPIPDGYEVIASSVLEQADETIVTAVLVFPGGDIEEIASHFDDYYAGIDGTSRTETSFEGGTQYVWLTEDGASTSAVARDGEDTVEVTLTQITG
jgi:hypothetical protein